MSAVVATECLPPSKSSHVLGMYANAWRIARKYVSAGAAGVLIGFLVGLLAGGWVGVALALPLLTSTMKLFLEDFFHWWLYERLLCLDEKGYECVLGMPWSVEKPEEKEGLEAFDNDYSLNLLLSPSQPGDPIEKFPTQAKYVRSHPSIDAEGMPTLGVATTAAQLTEPLICEEGQIFPPPRHQIKSLEFLSDLDHLPSHGAGLDHWETYRINPATGTQRPRSDAGDGWRTKEELLILIHNAQYATNLPLPEVVYPDTQLLHCEFEGTGILELLETLRSVWFNVLLAVINLGFLAVAALLLSGVGLSVLWLLLGLLVLLALVLLWLIHRAKHQHPGNPMDAASDPRSGQVEPIPAENLDNQDHSCEGWDAQYQVVLIAGRWVFDSGHNRGWNEIHPVFHIQRVTDSSYDKRRERSGSRSLRPTTDEEVASRTSAYCSAIAESWKKNTWDNQNEAKNLWAHHPRTAPLP